jgi:putative oxidoreductase
MDKALLVIRVALGLIMALHGYGKLFGGQPGMEMFTGMVAGLGFPLPTVFAYAVALTEFFGGLAILIGLCTRKAAALVSVVMLVAFGMVKKFGLPKGDADLALLAMAVSLVLAGPGALSLDATCAKGKKK